MVVCMICATELSVDLVVSHKNRNDNVFVNKKDKVMFVENMFSHIC